MVKKLKIVGITFSITFVMFVALAIFIKGLGVLLNDWFTAYALIITIISGVVVFVGVLTGSIAFGTMLSRGKGFL